MTDNGFFILANQKLQEAEKIYEIYNHAALALQQYITGKNTICFYADLPNVLCYLRIVLRSHLIYVLLSSILVRYSNDERFTRLIKLLPSLSSMNESHRVAVCDLHQSRPDLHFPDLFVQMFQLDTGNNQSGGSAIPAIDVGDSGLVNSNE